MSIAQHPAYDVGARAIMCPLCRVEGGISEHTNVAAFERHFLAHDPGAELAREFLGPDSYAILAQARGWTRSVDKVLDQIRKLLALSKSPNEHEAALAAARAAELMIQYQISEAHLSDATGTAERVDAHAIAEMAKIVYWRACIAGALSKAFGAEMIFETVRRTVRRRRKKVIARHVRFLMIGSGTTAEAVRYMYRFLCVEIERLADESYVRRREGLLKVKSVRSYKDSYRKAAAMAIAVRLQDERRQRRDEAIRAAIEDDSMRRALVRLDATEAATRRYVESMGNISTYARPPDFSSSAGALDGNHDGKKMDLGRDKDLLNAGQRRLPERNDT